MSFDLILISSLAKLQRNGERNVSHDFTIKFPSPIYLDSGNYKAALKNISMSYSWYNIDAAYDNNKIFLLLTEFFLFYIKACQYVQSSTIS